MNRLLNAAAAAALALTSAAGWARPAIVDLDAAGALAMLRQEQPEQYRKVIAILQDAQRLPQAQVAGRLRTNYQADSVHFDQMLLVSYPPKRRLTFSLDKVPYVATIVVRLAPARIVPAD
jgi:hypothetical protein